MNGQYLNRQSCPTPSGESANTVTNYSFTHQTGWYSVWCDQGGATGGRNEDFTLIVLLSTLILAVHAATGEPVTLTTRSGKDGMLIANIENHEASPLTAMLIQATMRDGAKPKAVANKYMDIHVNASTDKPIAPGEAVSMPLLTQALADRWPQSIEIAGALFADGRKFGTPEGVRILVGRREALRSYLRQFSQRLETLSGAAIPAVRDSATGLNQELRNQAKTSPPVQIPLIAVGTQAAEWVSGVLNRVPAECNADCARNTVDYVIGGLAVWGGSADRGIQEAARQQIAQPDYTAGLP